MNRTYTQKLTHLQIKDWALGMSESPTPNRRVQIKMPEVVVRELDRLYPQVDRSQILTKLAIQAIYQQLKFADRPGLGEIVNQEQSTMDEMWQYLEARDGRV